MTKTFMIIGTVTGLLGCAPAQQIPTSQPVTLETAESRIEVIGLRRWTLTMLQDSLAKYAPEADLASHACAAVLRSELGFADASVSIPYSSTGPRRVNIAVVEPQDSSWIHYPENQGDSLPDVLDWKPGVDVSLEHPMEFQTSLQLYALLDEYPTDFPDSYKSEPGDELAGFLRTRTGDDLELALSTLAGDRNWHNRVIGYAILGRFPDDDRSWHALVEGIRDQSGPGSSTAAQVLSVLTRTASRPVSWSDMGGALRWLVNGTNLFGHTQLLRTLAATEIDPNLAPVVLQDSGGITPFKLSSSDEEIREAAFAFLRQISGEDFGYDVDTWLEWINSVR